MTSERSDGPRRRPRPARRQHGGVVTYGVVVLMVVLMFVYLVVAFFAEDGRDTALPDTPAVTATATPADTPPPAAEEGR